MRETVNVNQTLEFIRTALKEGRRLDGRGLRDCRALQINVASAKEASGRAEVLLGKTR
jgi:exosome complex RNA-binding protein Rrp42 (RNase PH superfamily)